MDIYSFKSDQKDQIDTLCNFIQETTEKLYRLENEQRLQNDRIIDLEVEIDKLKQPVEPTVKYFVGIDPFREPEVSDSLAQAEVVDTYKIH